MDQAPQELLKEIATVFDVEGFEKKADKVDAPWWKVAEAYFREHRFTEHQLNSFNEFMQDKLPTIITSSEMEYAKDDKKYIVNFEHVHTKKPEITEINGSIKKIKPQECRIRNLNYSCKVYVDITRYTLDAESKVIDTDAYKNICIGSIPIMVMSRYCLLADRDQQSLIRNEEDPHDPGGYFIISGNEKVLMSQDRMAHNEIFVFKCKPPPTKGRTKMTIGTGKSTRKNRVYDWSAEVRSYSEHSEPNITTTYIKLTAQQRDKGEEPRLYVEIPYLREAVPWPIVFMALGVTKAEDMIKYVCSLDDTKIVEILKPSLETPCITKQEEALAYLKDYVSSTHKEKRLEQLKVILREKLFQNVLGTLQKRYYLGNMTYQLLETAIGRRAADDRDHYAKKRVDTAGSLINNLFKSIWKRVLREAKSTLEKKRSSEVSSAFYCKITPLLKSPFSTGNWSCSKTTKTAKVGISQLLNRHNYVSTLSNIRRVHTPSDKNNKIIKPRHLHDSQFPYICPAETPEGQSTGLIKNLAMFTTISQGSPEQVIIDWLAVLGVQQLNDTLVPSGTKIFVNGRWIACTSEPQQVLGRLCKLRRQGKINYDVSLGISREGLRIFTDEGRLIAPFLVINDGKLVDLPDIFGWWELLSAGIIEYLDPAELETLPKISCTPWAVDSRHTHSLIHPAFILGISASTVPFPDHNQSPRNLYQSAMGKQALGTFATNFLYRYDTSAHVLCYPQRPLVNTQTMKLLGSEELPAGQNLIVAVASYTGYNQEDSVIINRTALDTGALRSLNYTTYCESNHKKGNTAEEIKRPEKKFNVRETRLVGYSKLDEDGVAKEGIPLAKRDIVIGKVTTTPEMVRDSSVVIKSNGLEEDSVIEFERDDDRVYAVYTGTSFVDRAVLTQNSDSHRTVKVRTRQLRIPQIGDKVASRHAQKGIIGMILSRENMPFSRETGMSPDLIMNPHALPSRMTVGQPLECLLSKVCAVAGRRDDCTPFDPDFSYKNIAEELRKLGFNQHGDEVMINGMTGEEMPCQIFIGPTYYQRLKHMVDDKIHARDQNGPRETLTRQPVEGRKRQGGFKMGEMETWCGISHGVSDFLIDRLVNNSDGYEMYVCDHCGNIAIANLKNQTFECKRCQQNIRISKVKIPYAFKLLQQELMATGIGVWYQVDADSEEEAS